MLPLPGFELHQPQTLDEALALLSRLGGDAKILAGGTDLLPNMKHGVQEPKHLVSLGRVSGLKAIRLEGRRLEIGAMSTVAEVAAHPLTQRHAPSLAKAAAHIAGPQLREMGTLGGNVALDTRCVYYNQTYFWREALGFCLKKDGTVCHVVRGGQRCVAAASNDTAPVLLTTNATVLLRSASGEREVAAGDFYVPDGIRNTVLRADELVVAVRVPILADSEVANYEKLRVRAAIDYPALNVAFFAGRDDMSRLVSVRLAVSALGARPHVVKGLDQLLGRELNAATMSDLGTIAHKQCHPLTNISVDHHWRREIIPVLVERCVRGAVEKNARALAATSS